MMKYEMSEPIGEDSIKKSDGYYISKKSLIAIVTAFVLLLVGVAVLFYFIPRPSNEDEVVCPSVVPPPSDDPEDDIECPPMPDIPVEGPTESDPFYGRLSEDIKPKHYTVWLKIYLDPKDATKQYSFDGNVSIVMHVYATTNTIKIHVRDLNLYHENTYLTDSLQNDVAISHLYEDEVNQFYVIETATPLAAGEDYIFHANFDAPLTLNFHGLYRSFYGTPPNVVDLVASQCQSVAARTIFPCFDEPSFKATFDMIIVHRDKRHALSNMPVINETNIEDDWIETTFETSLVMPTYLLAVVVSDFPSLDLVDGDLTFRVWAQPDYITAANYSLHIGLKMLRFFEEHYGIPYPISKLDMVAIPQFLAGAMENWGLVQYSEGTMIYDPEVNTPSRKQTVALVVAHELAHKWFGNLVTMDWWEHIWLNEGFASFVTYLGVDHVEPDWKYWDSFHVLDMASAYTADSRSSSARPLILPVGWNSEISSMFDTITYSKGAAICRHFRSFLDESVIHNGIKDYLQTYQYSNTVSDDLWAILTRADEGFKGTDVKMVMDSFTLMAGHPIVTVNRTDTNTVIVEQTYFLTDPIDYYQDQYPNNGYIWHVPLTYTDSSYPNFLRPKEDWLYKDPLVINLAGLKDQDWVLFNIDKWGFYRVNYDDDNWQKLANQFKTDHTVITDQSRASTIDDAFKAAEPFHTDVINALRLTEYLDKEFENVVWETVLTNLDYTHRMLLRTAEFYLLEVYWSQKVRPLYESLGWDFSLGGHLDYFQRISAIETACTYGTEDCVTQALEQYRHWMSTGVNDIRDEVRSTVYCTAIRHGGLDEWEFAHAQVTNDTFGTTETDRLQSAMGCTDKSWLLQRYLEDENFATSTVISNIRGKSAVGYSLAWDYTMNNFEKLGLSYKTVWDFKDYMNTQYDLDQLNVFGSRNSNMSSDSAKGFYDAVQRVETNMDWMNKNKDSVKQWLLQVMNISATKTATKGATTDVPRPDTPSRQLTDQGPLIVDGKLGANRIPRISEELYQLQSHRKHKG
ncbi:aminopeptidase N-like isoform X2 [Ptychodera flava]|uniref:aminopeptidase N-like isoform X2 n=1 Tax=Ptychodera flava TaxID=63121 RepID=UPI00396A590A